jgi:hypothetical protein
MKHFIYEIKGVKIGCTKDLEARVAMYNKAGFDYKLEDLIIQDILYNETDEYAGEYERFLQKKLGYPVDDCPYHETIKSLKIQAEKGGKIAAEVNRKNGTGLWDHKIQSMGGKIGGKITAEVNRKNGTGFFDPKIQSIGGKIGGKIAAEVNRKNSTGMFAKIKCKYCDYVGNAPAIGRYHNEKCKNKGE